MGAFVISILMFMAGTGEGGKTRRWEVWMWPAAHGADIVCFSGPPGDAATTIEGSQTAIIQTGGWETAGWLTVVP